MDGHYPMVMQPHSQQMDIKSWQLILQEIQLECIHILLRLHKVTIFYLLRMMLMRLSWGSVGRANPMLVDSIVNTMITTPFFKDAQPIWPSQATLALSMIHIYRYVWIVVLDTILVMEDASLILLVQPDSTLAMENAFPSTLFVTFLTYLLVTV